MPVPPVQPTPERYVHVTDPDPAVRARAAQELAADPNPHAVEALVILATRDRDPSVRVAAAQAIAERRDPDLDDVLKHAAMTDADPSVRAAASTAHEHLWPWGKQPRLAAGLSVICPGCGH